MLMRDLLCSFTPGRLVATPGVLCAIPQRELHCALQRHVGRDWGEVSETDKRLNDRALKTGERLVSKYHTSDDRDFLIITEADRSATTVMLPEEY